MKRYDERDTMFARMTYQEGEENYEDYYSRHPEKKETDDALRNSPEIASEQTPTYDPLYSNLAVSNFKFLADIRPLAEGIPRHRRVNFDLEDISKKLKNVAINAGANFVGIAKAKPYHYYSHRGRPARHYGEKVKELLPYAIVFGVKMKRENIDQAPLAPEVMESSRTYVEAAIIGMQLSYLIRELGYNARNHMDGNYLVVLPTLARDAGLGEIGRNGLLITPKYGPAVRLGAVTTDIPLKVDKRLDVKVEGFCEICGLCSKGCPMQAIPMGKRSMIDGELRWQINQEKCYSFWRKIGTDCGLCMKNCPFGNGIDLMDLKEHESEELMEIYKKKKRKS
jgi:ferredoxin